MIQNILRPTPGGECGDCGEGETDLDLPDFGRIVGADIVELNPSRDMHHCREGVGMTAMVAAKVLKELVTRMTMDNGRVC